MSDPEPTLYTIGHSGLTIGDFLSYIKNYGITRVVDIRSWTDLRSAPEYNLVNFGNSLRAAGVMHTFIDYQQSARGSIQVIVHDRTQEEFYDNTLGGIPKSPAIYGDDLPRSRAIRQLKDERGKLYRRIWNTLWFKEGSKRLREMLEQGEQVAIVCQCKDYPDCHGNNLVAEYLRRTLPNLSVLRITDSGGISQQV